MHATGNACELVERVMHTRNDRKHPALRHGAYSAIAVLPGENRAEFEKLRRDLIEELTPSGASEDAIVMDITRLRWRKQNLATLRISERAQNRRKAVVNENLSPASDDFLSLALASVFLEREKASRLAAEREIEEAQEELGELYELTEIGEAATFDGLKKELDILERLDAAINRCWKQLLLVRGVKSLTAAPSSTSPKRLTGPQKPRN